MNDDAEYILDLLRMQRYSLKCELLNKKIRRDKFDRFSYSAWAIQETLDAVEQYGSYHYITVSVIAGILQEQRAEYSRFYDVDNERHKKYEYALDIVDHFTKLTWGYLYE